MHPLHDDIARQLGEKVKARSVVVWYDPRAEFLPFVDELRGAPATPGDVATVTVGGGEGVPITGGAIRCSTRTCRVGSSVDA